MQGLMVALKNDHKRIIYLWTIFIFFNIFCFLLFTKWSFFKFDALIIWIFFCIAIVFLSQKMSSCEKKRNKIMILLGIMLIIYSFFNIPLGFGNPPYSIGDFSLLLSGVNLVFFGIMGYRSLLLPALLPAIAVIGFQLYDNFSFYLVWFSQPLIPLIIHSTTFFLSVLQVDFISKANYISYNSLSGDSVNLVITENCTGIWSLGTFAITCLIIIASFPQARTRKSIFYFFIGFLGTIASNILRIWLIVFVGRYFGSHAAIKFTHDYFGWLFFTFWVIIFWYLFITRHLNISVTGEIWNKKSR